MTSHKGMHAPQLTALVGTALVSVALVSVALVSIALVLDPARAHAQVVVQPDPGPQVVVQPDPGPQVVVQPSPGPQVVVQPVPQQQVYVQPAGAAPYGYGQPAGPPPRRERGPNVGLIVSGAVMLGVGWIVNGFVGIFAGASLDGAASDRWDAFRYSSWIPLVGPWVQLAVKPTAFDADDWGTWLILDGLLQTAGAALLIAGIATSGGDEPGFSVLPTAGPNHAGLSLVGRF